MVLKGKEMKRRWLAVQSLHHVSNYAKRKYLSPSDFSRCVSKLIFFITVPGVRGRMGLQSVL